MRLFFLSLFTFLFSLFSLLVEFLPNEKKGTENFFDAWHAYRSISYWQFEGFDVKRLLGIMMLAKDC